MRFIFRVLKTKFLPDHIELIKYVIISTGFSNLLVTKAQTPNIVTCNF